MQVVKYYQEKFEDWDMFVENSLNGTFLHTRRYLAYHGDNFNDVSVLISDENEKLIGVFPAAIDLKNERHVVSHPGITYGGIVHKGDLSGSKMIEAVASLKSFYISQNFELLRYKAVPHIYHCTPTNDDLYALFINDAKRYRCDLSCAINLAHRKEISRRRKRSLKKSLKYGVQIDEGNHFAAELWEILEENLAVKYNARPVHSLEEITLLHSSFPENIRFVVALMDKKVIAGVVLFLTETVAHAQYIASSSTGYEMSALDAVFNNCIEKAAAEYKNYFDFGTSNEDEGRKLNESLYNFKSEFSGGGVAHEFYEIDLMLN